VLNGGTSSCLKLWFTTIASDVCTLADYVGIAYLDDGLTIIGVLGIDDDFQVHSFFLHDTLQSYPTIVREKSWRAESSRDKPLRLIQRLFVLKVLNLWTV
jgi:hypothetical protein